MSALCACLWCVWPVRYICIIYTHKDVQTWCTSVHLPTSNIPTTLLLVEFGELQHETVMINPSAIINRCQCIRIWVVQQLPINNGCISSFAVPFLLLLERTISLKCGKPVSFLPNSICMEMKLHQQLCTFAYSSDFNILLWVFQVVWISKYLCRLHRENNFGFMAAR